MWLLLIVFGGYLFWNWFQVLHWTALVQQFSAYDLGLHDQGIWLLSQNLPVFSTIKGVPLFGDHLSFHYFFPALIMKFWDSVDVLFVVQVASYILSGIVFFAAFKNQLGSLVSFILVLIYWSHPAGTNMILENYHPEVSAILTLSLMLFFFVKNKPWWTIVFGLLSIAAKEDIAISVFSFSVYWLLQEIKNKKIFQSQIHFQMHFKQIQFWLNYRSIIFPIILAFICGMYFILGTKYLMPQYFMQLGIERSGFSSYWYKDLHWTHFFSLSFWGQILNSKALNYLYLVLGPVFIFVLVVPIQFILLLVPALVINIFSKSDYLMSIQFHYAYVWLPMLMFVTYLGVNRVLNFSWATKQKSVVYKNVVLTVILFSLAGMVYWHEVHSFINFQSQQNIIQQHKGFYLNAMPEIQKEWLVNIQRPENQSLKISANHLVVPSLSHRQNIFMFPNPFQCNLWNMWYQECKDRNFKGSDIDVIVFNPESFQGEFKQLAEFLIESDRYKVEKKGNLTVLKVRSNFERANNYKEFLSSSNVAIKIQTNSDSITEVFSDTLQFPWDPWQFQSVWGQKIETSFTKKIYINTILQLPFKLEKADLMIQSPQLKTWSLSLVPTKTNNYLYNLNIELDMFLNQMQPKGMLIKIKSPESGQWFLLSDKYLKANSADFFKPKTQQ